MGEHNGMSIASILQKKKKKKNMLQEDQTVRYNEDYDNDW